MLLTRLFWNVTASPNQEKYAYYVALITYATEHFNGPSQKNLTKYTQYTTIDRFTQLQVFHDFPHLHLPKCYK